MRIITIFILLGLFYNTVCGQVNITDLNNDTTPIYHKDGKVGIGTTEPISKLNIWNNSNSLDWNTVISNEYHSQTDRPGVGLKFKLGYKTETTKWAGIAAISSSEWENNIDLTFYTRYGDNPNERMRIRYDGNVGIGTASPSSKLHVYGTIRSDKVSILNWYNSNVGHTNSAFVMNGIRENGVWKLHGDGSRSSIGIIKTDIFSNMSFISHHDDTMNGGKTLTDEELINNNTKLIIRGSGEVGIGTTSPKAKLEVAGDIALSRAYKLKFLETVSGGERAYIRSTNGQNGESYNSLVFAVGAGNERLFVNGNTGNVGIGILNPSANFEVAGDILADEIRVEDIAVTDLQLNGTLAANNITYTANGNTADFVFEDNYHLKDLSEVEAFIKANRHLPEIPSAKEMEVAGVNLAEMNKLLLMKVEELTLYSIELEKEVKRQRVEVEKVESLELKVEELRKMEERLAKLEALLTK